MSISQGNNPGGGSISSSSINDDGGDEAGGNATGARSVHRWRIWCHNEPEVEPGAGGNWVEGWSTTKPTRCFNNRAHTTLPGSVQRLETVSTSAPIELLMEHVPPGGQPGGGWFRYKSLRFQRDDAVDENDFAIVPGVNTMMVRYDYISYVYGIEIHTLQEQKNDHLDIYVNPYYPVGTLVADVAPGETVLYVSPYVLALAFVGVDISLNDTDAPGAAPGEPLGEIIAIDKVAGTVRVERGPSRTFSATMPPTFVQLSVHPVNFHVGNAGTYRPGQFKLNSTRIEPGSHIMIVYTNVHDTNTDLTLVFEGTF